MNSESHKPLFILDVHLGKLAKHLRMLGFDSLWRDDYEDEQILRIQKEEGRIILTRDRRMLEENPASQGYLIQCIGPKEQAREVLRKFNLSSHIEPFTICLECNGRIVVIDKRDVEHLLELETKRSFKAFFKCISCNRVYWKGSHYERMMNLVRELDQGCH